MFFNLLEFFCFFSHFFIIVSGVTICEPSNCVEELCARISCFHGDCDLTGNCQCLPCWGGLECNIFEDMFPPAFESHSMVTKVEGDVSKGDFIYKIVAKDQDIQSTCSNNQGDEKYIKNCDCAKFKFEILSGNEEEYFKINQSTGEVKLNKNINHLLDGKKFVLRISLKNQDISDETNAIKQTDFALLTIYVGEIGYGEENIDAEEEVLQRYKRQTVPDTVSNITFSLIKTGLYNFTTSVYVGSKVHFQLLIQFPPSQTIDLNVELFTPENQTTIMQLCNPEIVHKGTNLNYNDISALPVLDANDGSINNDRAVLNFGSVSNSGTGLGMDSVVQVEFDAVLINSISIINGSYYWVSAGAEYNQQNEIWIGQAGFIAYLDDYTISPNSPQFNFTGPAQVAIGSSAVFRVDIYLPYPAVSLEFAAFSPLNFTDAVSICSVLVVDVGPNYECYDYKDLPLVLSPSSSGLTNDRGTLYIGHLVNKGSRENPYVSQDSRISVEFVANVPYNEAFIGSDLWVGATLLVGTSSIWASQLAFPVVSFVASSSLASPPTTTLYSADTLPDTFLHIPKKLFLDITIDINTKSNYSVQITTESTKYKICSVSVNKKGSNIPCMKPIGDPVYTSSVDGNEPDVVDWNLGELENLNIVSISNNPTANILQLVVFVVPLSYSGISEGTNNLVSGTVTAIGQTSSFSYSLTLSNISIFASALSWNSTQPQTSISFDFGSDTSVSTFSILDMRMIITFHPSTLSLPFIVQFSSLNSTTNFENFITIVKMEVISVGSNLPCTHQHLANQSVVYYQNYPDDAFTSKLDLPSVCSVAPPIYPYNFTEKDQIQLRVLLFIKNFDPLPASISLQSSVIYSSDTPLTFSTPLTLVARTPATYLATNLPHVVFDYNNSSGSSVDQGSQFKSEILIKTPPRSVADWKITADVTADSELSICGILIKNYGYFVPYLNKSTQTQKNGLGLGWVELFQVTNIGYQNITNNSYDYSSIILEAVVQISSTASLASKSVILNVDYGIDGTIDDSSTVTFDVITGSVPTYNSASYHPNISFNLAKINENSSNPSLNVFLGQTILLQTTLTFPSLLSNYYLKVRLVAPNDDSLDIVQYDVISAGINFPCLKKENFQPIFTTGSSGFLNKESILNLGGVCYIPISTLPLNNQLTIEAVATVARNSGLVDTDTINIQNIVTLNSTDLPAQTIILTIASTLPTLPDYNYIAGGVILSLNASDSVNYAESNTDVSFNVTLTILANTSGNILITLSLPSTTSAVMTVVDFKMIGVGKNLGSVQLPLPFIFTSSSSSSSSQKNQGTLAIDWVTNTGHSYKSNKYLPGDDDIVVMVTVKMMDSVANVNNTVSNAGLSATYLGISSTDDGLVGVLKKSDDYFYLDVNIITDSTITYTTSSLIPISIFIKHKNESRIECFNVKLIFLLPPFMDLTGSLSTDFINPSQPSLSHNAGDKAFYILVPHIYFSDEFFINITLQLTTPPFSNSPSEIARVLFEIELDLSGNSPLSTPPSNHGYPIQFLNFTLITQPIVLCPTGEVVLGMANKAITDCQISGSPGINSHLEVRPGAAGWKASLRSQAYPRFLHIHLANVVKVTKVTITQPITERISVMSVANSNDGINWVINNVLSLSDVATATDYFLTNPVDSIYIRFIINSTFTPNSMPSFTIELHGCIITSLTLNNEEFCRLRNGWQSRTPNSAFKKRSIIYTGTILYFCDTKPNLEDMQCFSSVDGNSWTILDEEISNIIGYSPTTNRIYGLDSTKSAMIMSDDGGVTWFSISNSTYVNDYTNNLGFIQALDVPWTDSIATNPVIAGPFSAKFDGLYINSLKVADWMECCS